MLLSRNVELYMYILYTVTGYKLMYTPYAAKFHCLQQIYMHTECCNYATVYKLMYILYAAIMLPSRNAHVHTVLCNRLQSTNHICTRTYCMLY